MFASQPIMHILTLRTAHNVLVSSDLATHMSALVVLAWAVLALHASVKQTAYLLTTVWDRDWAASLDAVEEPFLNRVVVQGTVDVDWTDTGEVHSLVSQQLFCI